ncbi:acyltransferase, WS/DGAT/MGAT [Geodermatophilus obscurus]|uniref:diacylglycerol O-acyltransferase n=1 Tax=Geodermatophilus obscurus TaxID=1861 RepID=A0A1M7UZK7_9ACTN|nr:wax ester/triacylglycerol synthase domain-containing protein [Geodermatophilus obscurus]SHN88443.1 acyltransferase, WS/DGAT/MGAT [Geodermatophilus obscurus]
MTEDRGGVLPRIERAGPTDLAFRAMGSGGALQEQLGAVLLLGPGAEPPAVERAVAERMGAVPRLRQRLERVPPGAGRPVWVDDPSADARRHVRRAECSPPGGQQALLDVAAAVVTQPLPQDRPLWSAVVVTGLADGRIGLVVVLHHLLTDGVGGLAVLGYIVDGAAPSPTVDGFPRPRPPWRRLAVDAARSRAAALTRWRATARQARAALTAAGGMLPPPAAACSLLARTGPHRRLAVVRADLAALRAAAHDCGATVNDALLVAVAGALATLLADRRESVDPLAVAVPVAARHSAEVADLGNAVTPLVVAVPTSGPPVDRLRRFAGTVRAAQATVSGPPLIAAAGWLFRLLATVGLYRAYLRHQRRFHTLVSNVHGPDRPVTLAGAPVEAVVPVAVGDAGNMTVSFEALSYAGTLAVTVIADADAVPDLPVLVAALEDQFTQLATRSAPPGRQE